MPRTETSIDLIVRNAMEGVVRRASVAIARAISEMAAQRLDQELRRGIVGRKMGRGRMSGYRVRTTRPRQEITRWAADRRARRVPNFVIEQTGLKTKKQIVAKFGEGVTFEKGKALPRPSR
jgi:hypothetical protein